MTVKKYFEYSVKSQYLLVTYGPVMERHDLDEFLDAVPILAKTAGLKKVLVDLRATDIRLDMLDHYDGGEKFAETFDQLETAFVFNEVKSNYSFGETVAFNRGGVLCLFQSYKKACEWLGVAELTALS